jgi:excisionase family DNA binding protein
MSAPEILNADEVAEILRLRRSTVMDLARRGDLPRIKIGRRVLFVRADVLAHVERLRTGGRGH